MDLARARMLADLGTATRDRVSAPLEGNITARAAEREEARIRAENRARQQLIIDGPADGDKEDKEQHRALSLWNTPATFGGGGDDADDLLNRFDGQGHRRQLHDRVVGQHDRGREFQGGGNGNMQHRGGPGVGRDYPPPRAPREPLADPNRQRAPSPRAAGTRRFVPTRQGLTPNAANTPQHGGIPAIGQQLASRVQGLSASGTAPILSSSTPIAQASPHLAVQPPARSASPALSTASSTSTLNPGVADAQARIRAQFARDQQARSATPAASPSTQPAATITIHAAEDTENIDPNSSTADTSRPAASPFIPSDGHDAPWPSWEAPPAALHSSPADPKVAQAQRAIKAHLGSQQGSQSTDDPATASSFATSTPTSLRAPHLSRRRVTDGGATNGAASSPAAPMPSASAASSHNAGPNGIVPRDRVALTNGTGSSNPLPRSRATNGASPSPAPTAPTSSRAAAQASPAPAASMSSPTVAQQAPRPSAAGANSQVANGPRFVQDDPIIMKALINAKKRTPKELDAIEKHYAEFPENRPALDKARQHLARKYVQLAADGDQDEVEAYLRGQHPDPRWLIEAAFSAWAGATPEDATHPTVQAIIKATEIKKREAEQSANPPNATPTAQPPTPNGNAPLSASSNGSAAAANTNSTAGSTPTPPRTALGTLAATFLNAAGRFLESREVQLPVPVTAHLLLTSRTNDFNPLSLADAMESIAKCLSKPKASD
ncbi:hypothetical protein PRZ48_012248 [Zasmidium cellare]|uniref:Uncharacterized protein n=1 Tax=Zasmidium cellare TaxID=395010 RepID=A0ABR0E4R6_ZASCE|nr:hypothetical protein PRZ48_012248 [Zasmidium cellare]